MIDRACTLLLSAIPGLSPGSRLYDTLHFFIYDTIKILLLLYAMIFIVGVVRTYISPKRIRKTLTGKNTVVSYTLASLLGAITPFCSCSSIPLFMSFIRASVPIGPALAFLATSPLINEYLAVLMLGFFGVKVTLAYIILGILLGITSGLVLKKAGAENLIDEDFKACGDEHEDEEYSGFSDRISYGKDEANAIVRMLWIWVVAGVGVGALIHGFVPEELIHTLISRAGILSVPLATLLGIPIYANCSAIVPVAAVLFRKGVPLGTALAFMMATAALSLPEAVILRRVMKPKLIILFFLVIGSGIMIIGLAFNANTLF